MKTKMEMVDHVISEINYAKSISVYAPMLILMVHWN